MSLPDVPRIPQIGVKLITHCSIDFIKNEKKLIFIRLQNIHQLVKFVQQLQSLDLVETRLFIFIHVVKITWRLVLIKSYQRFIEKPKMHLNQPARDDIFSSSFRYEFSFNRIWQKMSWWPRFFRILCRHSVTTTIYGHVPCWQLHSIKSPSQRWICCPVIGEYTFFKSAITIILHLIQC